MKKRTKLMVRIALAVGTIVSLFFVPWVMLKAWVAPLPDTVQEQVDKAINYKFDGMIVYVDEAGKPPAFYVSGWHNREKKIPAYPNALFKIASIGKLYDAVAITKLVDTNRLSLDKTVADYFPELVGRIENAEKITLKMMVQHRSGIPNYTNTPNYWEKPSLSQEEKLALILDKPASFHPNEGYEYSNTNYLLITKLIEKTVGTSKFQFIKNEVLIPLELNHTFGSLKEINSDDLMSGYYVGIEEDIKTADYGSMIASAEDVGVFLRALNDGSLLSDSEQKIYSSIYVYNHTGLIPGYQSIAKYHKDIDTVVIQFMNTTNFSGYNWGLSEIFYNRIVKIVRKKRLQEPYFSKNDVGKIKLKVIRFFSKFAKLLDS